MAPRSAEAIRRVHVLPASRLNGTHGCETALITMKVNAKLSRSPAALALKQFDAAMPVLGLFSGFESSAFEKYLHFRWAIVAVLHSCIYRGQEFVCLLAHKMEIQDISFCNIGLRRETIYLNQVNSEEPAPRKSAGGPQMEGTGMDGRERGGTQTDLITNPGRRARSYPIRNYRHGHRQTRALHKPCSGENERPAEEDGRPCSAGLPYLGRSPCAT